MSKRCDITGKQGQFGHRVSHAKNRTKHVFKPNIQSKKIFIPELGRSVRLNLSTKVIRTIDKIGFTRTMKKYKIALADIM